MNPPEYKTIAQELLPRFMYKLGKFLDIKDGELQILINKLTEIEKKSNEEAKQNLINVITDTVSNIINVTYASIDIYQQQKSIMDIISELNSNIRMPTYAINSLLTYIWEQLEINNKPTNIVTSACETIICKDSEFNLIVKHVSLWLHTNKAHYVIL